MNDSFALEKAISQRRSCRHFLSEPLEPGALQRLIHAGQGITDKSNKRAVPSAHRLHPLHLLVTVGNVEGESLGLFEANPGQGVLTPIHKHDIRSELERCAIDSQPWIRDAACIITVCADFVAPAQEFSEQPPYGDRGSRYVYIEAGAAAQNIALQAVAEGLGCVLVAGFRDEATADVLKLGSPYKPILHLCLGVPAPE